MGERPQVVPARGVHVDPNMLLGENIPYAEFSAQELVGQPQKTTDDQHVGVDQPPIGKARNASMFEILSRWSR